MTVKLGRQALVSGVFVFFFMAAGLFAQVERGTISGTISDSSGAPMIGVVITVTNAATGVEFKTITSDQGQYVAPNLIPGRYRVLASQAGFKTVAREDVIARANERSTVDLLLQVGEVTERIEVTGDLAPLLTKESSTVTGFLETQQVTELPSLDRTIFNLASLMPGVTVANTQANSIGIPDNARVSMGLNANGGGTSSINSFTLDGVNNTQVSATSSYLGIVPNLEAIEEFTIDTSNSTAEQGRGGTSVRITLKSGTNKLHGSIFEFHRNAALNARNFFDNQAAQGSSRRLPNFIQNQFGGTLGGPIRKDKTFFFADYQGFRQRQGQTWVSTVPSAALRDGDFSGTSQPIYDPATWNAATGTRQLFPGNRIDPSRFSPAAKNLLAFMPLPNDPSGVLNPLGLGYFFSSSSLKRTQDSFDAKIDHVFSEKDSFAGRFSWGRSHTVLPGAYTDIPQYAPAQGGALQQRGAEQYLPGTVSNPSAQIGLQWIHNFSPTTINEARLSWLRSGADAQVLGHGHNYADQIGIPNANVDDINSGFPSMYITGVTSVGEGGAYPLINIENGYQALDNTTLVRGSHTVKLGVDVRMQRQTFLQLLGGQAGGSFNFDQYITGDPGNVAATGNAMASFLLGVPASASLSRLTGTHGMHWWEVSGYAQDTWKVNRKFTLNYGLRYELFTPYTEAHDRMTDLDLVTGKLVLPKGGGSHPAFSTRALVNGSYKNFEPRIGLAYQLTPKTVLRSGFAVQSANGWGKAFGFMTGNSPFSGGVNYFNTASPQQIVRTLDEGFPSTQPFNTIDNTGPLIWGADPDGPKGYTEQWNGGIQRQLASNLALEVNYVGSSSHHLIGWKQPNTAALGTGPYPQRTPYYATLPNAPTILYWVWRNNATYNGLQANITKRFSSGLSFQANYTWSHNLGSIDFAQADNPVHANLDINAPQRFAANALWEIPFGRGKRHGHDMNPFLDAFIGGWRLGGVLAFQTGFPYTVTGGAGLPNRTCNGQTPPEGHTVQKWFDTSCFVLPPTVTDPVYGGEYIPYGNSSYNILTADGIRQNDLSLTKFFNVMEGQRVQFRAEFFNVTNNPQFKVPLNNIQSGTAGLITGAFAARQLQLALKYSW